MQPPALWQRDADPAPAGGASPGGGAGGVYDSDERIADSWRHVKHVAREGSKEYDLLDLLQNARREETYSFPVPGWPGLLRPLSGAMNELPPMVQVRGDGAHSACAHSSVDAHTRAQALWLPSWQLLRHAFKQPPTHLKFTRKRHVRRTSTAPARRCASAACSLRSGAPGRASTTASSCGATTAGGSSFKKQVQPAESCW